MFPRICQWNHYVFSFLCEMVLTANSICLIDIELLRWSIPSWMRFGSFCFIQHSLFHLSHQIIDLIVPSLLNNHRISSAVSSLLFPISVFTSLSILLIFLLNKSWFYWFFPAIFSIQLISALILIIFFILLISFAFLSVLVVSSWKLRSLVWDHFSFLM